MPRTTSSRRQISRSMSRWRDGQPNHFKYYVRRRARPTVKVLCVETNKPVARVKVKLGTYQLSPANANGIATLQPDEWVDPASYKIALEFDDPSHSTSFEGETYPRFELIDGENPNRDVDDDDTQEFLVRVHASGALVVEVFRYDGKPLNRRVTFNLLDGPSKKNGFQTLETPRKWRSKDTTAQDVCAAARPRIPPISRIRPSGASTNPQRARSSVTGWRCRSLGRENTRFSYAMSTRSRPRKRPSAAWRYGRSVRTNKGRCRSKSSRTKEAACASL